MQNARSAAAAVGAGILAVALIVTAGTAGAASVAKAPTTHAVTQSSKANYSSAVERPTWSFSCDSATHAWRFSIDDVQVIDSTGRTWGGTEGPWSVGFFATRGAGAVPFSSTATLQQNTTNGLFTATASGTSSAAGRWCQKGASVTVEAFSGAEQPLLLDGTLG